MVVTTLFGGLGNQMFIYAMARALALRNREDLILNCNSGFKHDYAFRRQYALDNFAIQFRTNKWLSFDFNGGRLIRKISEKIGRHIIFPSYKMVSEISQNKYFEDKWIEKPQHNIILNGYWQSEKYFEDYGDQIRQDFRFTKLFSDEVARQANMIAQTEGTPVALGIRLYQECATLTIPVTDKEYYSRAMQYIVEQVPDAVFYVFTQVPEWAINNLSNHFQFKIMQGNKAIDDLYLITLCKHHIISNSSLYWWGAWLADIGGIIVSPKSVMNKDFIPNNWIKLD
jgi:hypothetical protein